MHISKWLIVFFLTISGVWLIGHIFFTATIYQGEKYSVLGKGASGLCRLINESPCVLTQKLTFKMEDVISKKVDLAIVSKRLIKDSSEFRVLMNIDTDGNTLLVAGIDLPMAKGLDVLSKLSRFKYQGLSFEQKKRVHFNRGGELGAAQPYLELKKTYKLHPVVVKHYLSLLEEPLNITTMKQTCDRRGWACTIINGPRFKNYRISQHIAKMGMSIAPYLIEALSSDNDFLVMKSAYALGEIWPHDSNVMIPPLLKLLNHKNDEVKEVAIQSLAKIEPQSPEIYSALFDIAQQPPITRQDFSDGSIGGILQKRLIVVQQEPISLHAIYSLVKIDPVSILPFLINLVKSEDEINQEMGIKGIRLYLHRVRKEINRGRSLQESRKLHKEFNIGKLPDVTLRILAFLIDIQDTRSENNRQLITYVLESFKLKNMSSTQMSSLVQKLRQSQKGNDKLNEEEKSNISDLDKLINSKKIEKQKYNFLESLEQYYQVKSEEFETYSNEGSNSRLSEYLS